MNVATVATAELREVKPRRRRHSFARAPRRPGDASGQTALAVRLQHGGAGSAQQAKIILSETAITLSLTPNACQKLVKGSRIPCLEGRPPVRLWHG